MKAKLKGLLLGASKMEIFEKDDKKTKLVRLQVKEPARKNEFDEVVGKDQIHEVRVMNSAIDKLPMEIIDVITSKNFDYPSGKKVEVEVWVNSRQFENNDGKKMTATELSLAKLEILN